MAPRYAVYFVPRPETELARFGARVIGYDIWSGDTVPFPDLAAYAGGTPAFTHEPRRYGFHATLKAPFHLRDGVDEAALRSRAAAFAQAQTPVPLGRLEVRALSGFLALVPVAPPPALAQLAAACVRAFDAFRAPLTEADRARRLKSRLTERQLAHLDAWGYPHVFDDFRFHMTLTGTLDAPMREALAAPLATLWSAIDEPVVIEGIALVVQPAPDAPFRVKDYLPFTSRTAP